MISIEIELWSARTGDESALCTIAIANVGGDEERAFYQYAISHQYDSVHGIRARHKTDMAKPNAGQLFDLPEWIWKKGTVGPFVRQAGVAKLLGLCLHDAGLTKGK